MVERIFFFFGFPKFQLQNNCVYRLFVCLLCIALLCYAFDFDFAFVFLLVIFCFNFIFLSVLYFKSVSHGLVIPSDPTQRFHLCKTVN